MTKKEIQEQYVIDLVKLRIAINLIQETLAGFQQSEKDELLKKLKGWKDRLSERIN